MNDKEHLVNVFKTMTRIVEKIESHTKGLLEIPLVDVTWLNRFMTLYYGNSMMNLDVVEGLFRNIAMWEIEHAVEDERPISLEGHQTIPLKMLLKPFPRNIMITDESSPGGPRLRLMSTREMQSNCLDPSAGLMDSMITSKEETTLSVPEYRMYELTSAIVSFKYMHCFKQKTDKPSHESDPALPVPPRGSIQKAMLGCYKTFS